MDWKQTPFRTGWWSFGLPGYRPARGTYDLYPYEMLPPIHAAEANNQLDWLLSPFLRTPSIRIDERPSHQTSILNATHLTDMRTAATALQLTLPDSFITFLQSPTLQERVPSCTACYLDRGTRLIPCPLGSDGYLLRFLNDQQWCLFWYLYLTPRGEHCVVASPAGFDCWDGEAEDEGDEEVPEEVSEEVSEGPDQESLERVTVYCAPSFATFLYRFWLENEIWYVLWKQDRPLTEHEQRYLQDYHPMGNEPGL